MKENGSNSVVGLLGILGVVFVTLKLTGHIDWSWWYVTMPFWIGFALLAVIVIAFLSVQSLKLVAAISVSIFKKGEYK